MTDKQILLTLFVLSGLLLTGLSVPLLNNRVRPNWFYGFRLQKAFQDEKTWYATNRYGAWRLLWSGISIVAAAVVLYFFPALSLDAYSLACLAVFAVVFITGLIQTVRYMNSL
jgi:uncharacterized membrane protein